MNKELQKLNDIKKNNPFLYNSINTTAKVYKSYWNCETLQEARETALTLRGL